MVNINRLLADTRAPKQGFGCAPSVLPKLLAQRSIFQQSPDRFRQPIRQHIILVNQQASHSILNKEWNARYRGPNNRCAARHRLLKGHRRGLLPRRHDNDRRSGVLIQQFLIADNSSEDNVVGEVMLRNSGPHCIGVVIINYLAHDAKMNRNAALFHLVNSVDEMKLPFPRLDTSDTKYSSVFFHLGNIEKGIVNRIRNGV